MEYPDLIRAGCKAGEAEPAGGIAVQNRLRALDDHLGALQKSPVEAVEQHAGNLGGAGFRGRGWRSGGLLRRQAAAGSDDGKRGNELVGSDWSHRSSRRREV